MPLFDAHGRPYPRQDGQPAVFRNRITGIGTGRDKTTGGSFFAPWPLQYPEILAMMNGSDLARKIVEKRPKEMMRRGYEVRCKELDDEDLKAIEDKATELRLNEVFLDIAIWARAFGGGLAMIGADDGNSPDEPLDETRIKAVRFINPIDRRFIWVQRYYADPLSPKYGLPEIYLISNSVAFGGTIGNLTSPKTVHQAAISIHESRVIRFDGIPTDVLTRQQLAGWTWSVLQPVYDVLRRFNDAFDSICNLLADNAQGVFKIKNLDEKIAYNAAELHARMAMVDLYRSSARAVLVDAEGEDFVRQPTPLAGVADTGGLVMLRLAAAADMPITELFGRSPAGLNATGESDTRKWYDTIATEQESVLSPKLIRVLRLIALSDELAIAKAKVAKITIRHNPLWQPTDKEQADVELATAQRDQIYLQEGVVTPEQVALGRFGTGKFSSWIDVDVEALQEAIEGRVQYDPHENEPDDPALIGAPGQGEAAAPAVPLPLPGAPSLAGTKAQNAAASPQRQPNPLPGAAAQKPKAKPGVRPPKKPPKQ